MTKVVLVTGATGKVGSVLVDRLLGLPDVRVRALCHNRRVTDNRVEVVTGGMERRGDLAAAVDGVTHVVHLATCKEDADQIMDVAVRGLFWLLEECRGAGGFEQFVLVGGDAAVGHYFYDRDRPVTEEVPFSAYPGCYALSKVLEEVLVEQCGIQYGLNWCCLRAPLVLEKDDLRASMSLSGEGFGSPDWSTLVDADVMRRAAASGAVPRPLDAHGQPLRRNVVHVRDLVDAILAALANPVTYQQRFNVAPDEPFDYGLACDHLERAWGVPHLDVPTPYFSTWLDNAKARSQLGWRPTFDTVALVDDAWRYQRAADDPRVVWYSG